jgi:hypothetical protein
VKQLLEKIFQPNVNKRITAEQILYDPWCRKPGDQKPDSLSKKTTTSAMKTQFSTTQIVEEEEKT